MAAGIQDLPKEVFVAIIQLSTGSTKKTYYNNLHRLAQVSKSWALVVLGTPPLWSFVCSYRLPSTLETALARSKATLLSFEVSFADPWVMPQKDLVATMSQHVDRWKTADLTVSDPRSLRELGDLAAPKLVHLKLGVCRPGFAEMLGVTLFQAGAPKLSHIELAGISLDDWTAPYLSGLRVLHLAYTGDSKCGPSMRELLDVLRASPGLKELSLTRVTPRAEIEPTVDLQPDHVNMNELISLTINQLTPSVSRHMLNSIQVPFCRDYTFGPDLMGTHPTWFNPLGSWVVSAQPLLQSALGAQDAGAIEAEIVIDKDQHLSCKILEGNAPTLNLRFVDIHIEQALNWILSFDVIRNGLPLRLDVHAWGNRKGHKFRATFQLLPHVRSLVVRDVQDDWSNPIMHLCGPEKNHGKTPWLLPNLESLTIIDLAPGKHVKVLLKLARARQVANRKNDKAGRTAVALAELVVYHQANARSGGYAMGRRLFNRIKALLGSHSTRVYAVDERDVAHRCFVGEEEEASPGGTNEGAAEDGWEDDVDEAGASREEMMHELDENLPSGLTDA